MRRFDRIQRSTAWSRRLSSGVAASHIPPRRARELHLVPDPPPVARDPSLRDAIRLVEASAGEALRIGCLQTIVVVDAGGDIVAQARMDGAWRDAGEIALAKAAAACAFDLETDRLLEFDHPALELFDGPSPEWRILAGGVPLHRAGVTVGAVGVAGGNADEDRACARAAAAAL